MNSSWGRPLHRVGCLEGQGGLRAPGSSWGDVASWPLAALAAPRPCAPVAPRSCAAAAQCLCATTTSMMWRIEQSGCACACGTGHYDVLVLCVRWVFPTLEAYKTICNPQVTSPAPTSHPQSMSKLVVPCLIGRLIMISRWLFRWLVFWSV